jgi:hypothetical protein
LRSLLIRRAGASGAERDRPAAPPAGDLEGVADREARHPPVVELAPELDHALNAVAVTALDPEDVASYATRAGELVAEAGHGWPSTIGLNTRHTSITGDIWNILGISLISGPLKKKRNLLCTRYQGYT